MTVSQFQNAADILKGRLDVLTDGQPYEIQVQNGYINLVVPKQMFAGRDPDIILQCYLTRKTDLFAFDLDDMEEDTPDYFDLYRSDIESVELKKGKIDGADVSELEVEDENGEYHPLRPFLQLDLDAARELLTLQADETIYVDNRITARKDGHINFGHPSGP